MSKFGSFLLLVWISFYAIAASHKRLDDQCLPGMNTYALAWFRPMAERTFLVAGNYARKNQLYELNHRTLTISELAQDAPFATNSATLSVAWLQCMDGSLFLAEGNYDQANRMYAFDYRSSRFVHVSEFSPYSRTTSLAWLSSPDGRVFLAEGNYQQPNKLYEFDHQNMQLLERAQELPFACGSGTESLAWFVCADDTIVLAEGNHGANCLYTFDATSQKLVEIPQAEPFTNRSFTYSFNWLSLDDHTILLAEGVSGVSRLYAFDEATKILTEIPQPASFSAHADVLDVQWISLPDKSIFLMQADYNQPNKLYELDIATRQLRYKQQFSYKTDTRSLSLLALRNHIFLAEGNGSTPCTVRVFDVRHGLLSDNLALASDICLRNLEIFNQES